MRSWRDVARPIIDRILRETKGEDEKTIKQALFDAYPFGERRFHPYKVWLDEIRRQRGLKRTRTHRKIESPENQGDLFDE